MSTKNTPYDDLSALIGQARLAREQYLVSLNELRWKVRLIDRLSPSGAAAAVAVVEYLYYSEAQMSLLSVLKLLVPTVNQQSEKKEG